MSSCLRRTLLSFCLFVSFVQVIKAQGSISGIVTDSVDNPLYYTTVVLKKDTATMRIAITDSMGKFQFDSLNNIEYSLTFTRIGFKEKVVKTKLTNDIIMKYVLDSDNSVLANVTVSSTRELERKADRFIFTPNKALTEGSTAADLFRHVPLVRYDERSNAISLIGRPGTKIYINNRNTDIPSHMLAEILRSMPASNIKSIDLITNPGSEYSANTTGGVININLKRQLNEGWLGSMTLQSAQGPYNNSILSSYLNYRKGKIGLQILPEFSSNYNYFKTKTGLVYTNDNTTEINSRYYRRYNVYGNGLKIDYDINKRNFLSYNGWFSYVKGKSNNNVVSLFSRENQSQPDSTEILNTVGNDKFIYNYGNINYHRSIDSLDQKYLDLNIDYNNFFQQRDNSWNVNAKNYFSSHLPQNFLNLSAKLLYKHKLSNVAAFMTGFQVSSTKTDNNQNYYTIANGDVRETRGQNVHYKYDEQYYAVFGNLAHSFGQKWNTKVGLRLEAMKYSTAELNNNANADSSYMTLFPDAGVSFSLNNRNQFSLNYAKKINRPNIELLFPGRTYISTTYFVQNNPFLQPVFLNRLDFFYTYNSRYIFSLTYQTTRNNYGNFIMPVVEDGETLLRKTYLNYGNTRNFSAAINFRQPVIKDVWSFYFTSSYNHTLYYGNTPEGEIRKINNSYGIYIDQSINISKARKWMAFATFNFSSLKTDISGINGSVSTLDLEVKKVFKNLSLNLRVSDIYNGQSNIRTQWFGNSALRENTQYLNSFGRIVSVKMMYSFGNQRVKGTKDRSSANDEIRKRVN